jgi:hypothetical protein
MLTLLRMIKTIKNYLLKIMGICQSKDLAICLIIFNPAKSKKLISNYFTMMEKLEPYNLPIFTLELVFNDREPEILGAYHVYGHSYMFHKERLCRLLEQQVPDKYKKIAFMDTDLFYDNINWYYQTSKLLDTYDVVQMFENAHWMNSKNTEKELTRKSVLFMKEEEFNFKYHPGFAWAFRREYYNDVGFFDWAVSGSGDTLSSAKWLNKTLPLNFKSLPRPLHTEYIKYFNKPNPKITYLKDVNIYHLYHGSRANRQYSQRHEMLFINQDIKELVFLNNQGIYEWTNKSKWNELFLNYFINRKDDEDEEEEEVLTS